MFVCLSMDGTENHNVLSQRSTKFSVPHGECMAEHVWENLRKNLINITQSSLSYSFPQRKLWAMCAYISAHPGNKIFLDETFSQSYPLSI